MFWRKYIILLIDTALAVYLVLAVTAFNNPDESKKICHEVNIIIADNNTNGFLDSDEIRKLLTKQELYPLNRPMSTVSPRQIEELLKSSPFIRSAQCYKSSDSLVAIEVTQRLPVIRIKSDNGDDYYLDDNGGVVPNAAYNSDLIVATGTFSQRFAMQSLSQMAQVICDDEFWNAQIEQINVLENGGIELVPRVGEHIIYFGQLPQAKDKAVQEKRIKEYVTSRLKRLQLFYQYGLSKTGWNKYHYINMEFGNQIICKRDASSEKPQTEAADENTEEKPKKETAQQPEPEKKPEKQSDKQPEKKPADKKADKKEPADKKESAKKEPAKKEPAKKETVKKDSEKKDSAKKDASKKESNNKKDSTKKKETTKKKESTKKDSPKKKKQ